MRCASSTMIVLNGNVLRMRGCTSQRDTVTSGLPPLGSHSAQRVRRIDPKPAKRDSRMSDSKFIITSAFGLLITALSVSVLFFIDPVITNVVAFGSHVTASFAQFI